MRGWFDPKDTLGLRCPVCGGENLRPEDFAVQRDKEGDLISPTLRLFTCLKEGCRKQFQITIEQYMKQRYEKEKATGSAGEPKEPPEDK